MTTKILKAIKEFERARAKAKKILNDAINDERERIFEEAGSPGFDGPMQIETKLDPLREAANKATLFTQALKVAVEALELYTHYDKESIRHMDTEFLKPERRAIIKPLNSIGKGFAPNDMHPNQIYQDGCFTYGPKEKPGKTARQAITEIERILLEGK